MRILYTTDFLLLPLFLLVIFALFYRSRERNYNNSPIKQYYLPALGFRLIGSVLTALMYQYYYGYGDTFYYFFGATDIFNVWFRDPATALEMILADYDNWSPSSLKSVRIHRLFREDSTAIVMQLGGLLSLPALGTFIGISLFMTTFAFVGCWRLFLVFVDLFPKLHFRLALAVLFVPSVCFWGTGLMKDSLTIGALGFFVYGFYFTLVNRKHVISSAFWMLFGGYLMVLVKVYVFISVLPACIVWLFLMYRERIPNPTIKAISGPIFLVIGGVGAVLALQRMGSISEAYSLENILDQAKKTQWWLSVSTARDGGTGYTLGEFDASLGGLIRVFPRAVNVTLFRPYLWEARKVIVLPSAVESFVCLCLTLFLLFRIGLFGFIRAIIANPVILFCLVFSIMFAFAVGFSTLNFGSLARYKIPCLPFYFTAMVLLFNHYDMLKAKRNLQQLSST